MRIKRIAHGDQVYSVGEAWPGAVRNGESGLVVGMINYTGAYSVETETEPNGTDEDGQPAGDPLTESEVAYYEVVCLPAELHAFYVRVEPKLLRGELTAEDRAECDRLLDRAAAKHPYLVVRRIFRDRVAVQVEDQENDLRPFYVSLLSSMLDAGRLLAERAAAAQAAATPSS